MKRFPDQERLCIIPSVELSLGRTAQEEFAQRRGIALDGHPSPQRPAGTVDRGTDRAPPSSQKYLKTALLFI